MSAPQTPYSSAYWPCDTCNKASPGIPVTLPLICKQWTHFTSQRCHWRRIAQIGLYKTTQFNHHPLLSCPSSQSREKSTVNYYWPGSHVFLESRAVAMLHSALYLSCPAGTTTPSLHSSSLPTATDAHTHIDVCACAGLVWWSSASTMSLYGCMTHRPACPTGVDFHSWSSLLKHIFAPQSVSCPVTSCANLLSYSWHTCTVCPRGYAAHTLAYL